jgi:hypothetical protein
VSLKFDFINLIEIYFRPSSNKIQEDLKPQTQDMKVPLAQLCIRDEVAAFLWSEVKYSRTVRHLDIEPFGTPDVSTK